MSPDASRILVVDDDTDACENLKDILTDCGYAVTVAHNGHDALELVSRQAFDVALLDLKMPGMDGLTLYRKIRQLRAGTVVVIISAFATGETAENALQAGAWRVLNKPVDVGRLMPLIDTAARQPLLMLVDDDRELCASLWDVLRERGYRVDVAHCGTEVGGQLAGRQHGIVIIDMKLPRGSGSEVFDQVRRTNPQARIVLITGHRLDLQDAIGRALADGADAVCYKPFDLPDLIGTIGRLADPLEGPA